MNETSQDVNLDKQQQQISKREQEIENQIKDLLPEEDDQLGRAYDSGLVRRLVTYMGPYKQRMIIAIVLMIVNSLLSVSQPLIIARAIDDGIRTGSLVTLRSWTLIFLVASIIVWATNRWRIAIMAYVGTGVVADFRSELFRHLHTLSLSFFNNYSVGRLMSRLISDVGVVQDFITWSITGLFRSIFTLTGIVIAMFILNWQLALVTFAVLPLMIILTNYWRKHVRVAYRATRQRLSLINGYLNESITGIRITKSFTREEQNFTYFNDLNLSFFSANVDASRISAIFFPGVDFMGSLATALVVGVGGWLVLGDDLTAGVLVAFVIYVESFFEPIRELAQRYNVFQATMAATERVFNLLDVKPMILDQDNARNPEDVAGHVVFSHVSFGYDDHSLVLDDVSLEAKPGERVALVGETGAGKSTIIRLVARFFDVTGGSLSIDGYDVREISQPSLRANLGIVLQDTFLFTGTIKENIRYGRLEASDNEVIAAATAVGADDFISRLPNGYDTEVGENGINLSAGQRQIISFARALLADPRILILDEATSSIDTATEKVIQQAMDTLMAGRTTFVIAHRLSTIVNSDQIIVLDRGRIVERGTHEALLNLQGRYYDLYTMQWARQES